MINIEERIKEDEKQNNYVLERESIYIYFDIKKLQSRISTQTHNIFYKKNE